MPNCITCGGVAKTPRFEVQTRTVWMAVASWEDLDCVLVDGDGNCQTFATTQAARDALATAGVDGIAIPVTI